jgi:hypothetical protein
MTENQAVNHSKRVYRVDKFIVPPRAREEFLDKVWNTHGLLRTLPVFMQDFVLEQSAGPGEFNFVTIVEWENTESIEKARAAVMSLHQAMDFSPQAMFARLEIKTDLANYQTIEG